MSEPEFYIPIDNDIMRFAQHLRTHCRTFLSAKFGDGKSFFLDRFKKDPSVSEEFKFITLYPINYQTVGNADIFNMLKYDILLQLLVDDMVSDVPTDESFWGIEDAEHFLQSLLEGFASVEPSPKAQIPVSAVKLFYALTKIHQKCRIRKGGKRAARTLLDLVEKSNVLYCEDVATKLIRHSLVEWKDKTKKKIVLVVEDLDRLDPAHLFRILNAFSAHMDYIYRTGEPPTDSLVGSRFGFDNIVLVLEYNNLKRLFGHFYGSDVLFSGYINKFIPQGYFDYSLRRTADNYFYESLSRVTGLEQTHIKFLLSPVINTISIRDMAFAIKDLEKQVSLERTSEIDTGFLLMLAVMKRLGMEIAEIIKSCEDLYKNETIPVIRYIIDFMEVNGFSDKKGYLKVDPTTMFYIAGRKQDGSVELGKQMPVPDEMRPFDMRSFVSRLFAYLLP